MPTIKVGATFSSSFVSLWLMGVSPEDLERGDSADPWDYDKYTGESIREVFQPGGVGVAA